MTLNPQLKLALDLAPVGVFFIGFKWLGLYDATALLLIVTLAILAITYAIERRVALSPLITAIVVSIFGGLTLWLHDESFIKIKPTLLYLIFSGILATGLLFKKGLLKPLLGVALQLTEEGWRLLSLRWALFFLFLALLNEYVRRNYSTEAWVDFKVFGCIGMTLLFAVLQAGFIQRHTLPEESKEDGAPSGAIKSQD